jgi:hypothetical protein
MDGAELSGSSDPTLAMKGGHVSIISYGDKGDRDSYLTDHNLREVHRWERT